jgi:L-lactate dehydrogenase complex protein LldG
MSDARSEILARIARASSKIVPTPWDEIPRDYRRSSIASQDELIALLKHRLRDYDAQVQESSVADAMESVSSMLKARGVSRIAVPPGLQGSLLPDSFEFIEDTGLSHAALNQCDGILTECTLAIAETGTIVLQNVPGQGRRAATLVPDYHLCIVDIAKVVATVPEAMERLRATADLPTTFISGPSATADIEMTRIKGVHGPRFLDVILLMK